MLIQGQKIVSGVLSSYCCKSVETVLKEVQICDKRCYDAIAVKKRWTPINRTKQDELEKARVMAQEAYDCYYASFRKTTNMDYSSFPNLPAAQKFASWAVVWALKTTDKDVLYSLKLIAFAKKYMKREVDAENAEQQLVDGFLIYQEKQAYNKFDIIEP